ncbi:MAG TPA: hypothetical protein VLJ39_03060 [Tepidisphaeraceae bacterium]|nr:hypothetical protein [Tepidisphaeraceae bacterium]
MPPPLPTPAVALRAPLSDLPAEPLSYESPAPAPLLIHFSICQEADTGRALQYLGPIAISGSDVTLTGRSVGIAEFKIALEARMGRAAASVTVFALGIVLFAAIMLLSFLIARSLEFYITTWAGFCIASIAFRLANHQRVVRLKHVAGESFVDAPRFILSIWMRPPEKRSGSWLIMRARSEADFHALVELIAPLLTGPAKVRSLHRFPVRSKLLIATGIASVLAILIIVAVFGPRSFFN